jgi:hypothetical protein
MGVNAHGNPRLRQLIPSEQVHTPKRTEDTLREFMVYSQMDTVFQGKYYQHDAKISRELEYLSGTNKNVNRT